MSYNPLFCTPLMPVRSYHVTFTRASASNWGFQAVSRIGPFDSIIMQHLMALCRASVSQKHARAGCASALAATAPQRTKPFPATQRAILNTKLCNHCQASPSHLWAPAMLNRTQAPVQLCTASSIKLHPGPRNGTLACPCPPLQPGQRDATLLRPHQPSWL